jgi:hypothetical protein
MINLKCDILIEKNEMNLFKIFVSNLSNNDSKLENEINSYLHLFNILLNDCFTKTKCFQDTQYNKLIENIKLEYDDKLNKINQELLLKDNEINIINNSFNSVSEKIKYNIESYLHQKFEIKEKILNDEIDLYKLKLNTLKNDMDNIIKSKINNVINEYQIKLDNEKNKLIQLNNNLDSLIELNSNAIKNKYEIINNNLNNELKLLQSKLSTSTQISNLENIVNNNFNQITKYFYNDDSSKSGELGEQFIYDYLSEFLHLNSGSISKVNGKNNAGDVFLQYDYLKCCIESKNHAANIRQEHIKRFTDIDILHPDYNSGIFISFKSEFVNSSNIKHFDLQFINNKPIIFISNFVKNKYHLILAIKVLNFILYHNHLNSSNSNDYISILNSHLNLLNELLSINNLIIKQVNSSNKHLNTSIYQFESILDIKSKKLKYNCSNCKFQTNNKSDLIKHTKICISDSVEEKISNK